MAMEAVCCVRKRRVTVDQIRNVAHRLTALVRFGRVAMPATKRIRRIEYLLALAGRYEERVTPKERALFRSELVVLEKAVLKATESKDVLARRLEHL